MSKHLLRIIVDITKRLKDMYELRKYNDFTIAEYFRKQGAMVGENCRIMVRDLGQDPYLVKIGNHCSISSGVAFVNHDGGGWIFTDEDPSLQRFGKIEIEDNCYIGNDCIILPNVTIKQNSIVGARSVVTKDVPPNTVVVGNPAKVIETIEEYKEKVFGIWKKQKPNGYLSRLKHSVIYEPRYIHEEKVKEENRKMLREHLKRVLWCSNEWDGVESK